MDLVIRGGTVGSARLDVGIDDGLIAAIAEELPGGTREIDASGLLVLPGAVDAHVHLNDPGRAHWEGIGHGSAALAVGGSTTAIDMPLNAHPPTINGAAFDLKADRIAKASQVDLALWGGIVPGNAGQLEELAARGVVGFKAFMSASGVDDFPAADDDVLGEGMREAARLGLPVAVHAESDTLTAALAAQAVAGRRTSMRDYLDSRPVSAETGAIERAIGLAAETGCALHVVHVSSGAGVALVAEARARGLDVSCETCPHYLVLTDEDAVRIGALAKCAPPLRPAAEVEALWAGLADGTLPMVASDHSPAPDDLKEGDDAFAIWGGIAGAQTMLALVLDGGAQRGIPRATLVDHVAGFPARRFRLAGKGRLEPGADADIALVGSEAWELRPSDLRSKHALSPFVGRTLHHRVVRTLLRGRTIQSGGNLIGPAAGRLVRPA